MRKRLCHILFLLMALLILRCAQIVPLTGGKRDTDPPKLIESSPIFNSVLFNTDQIVLRFDEFVQVKDLTNQLIISPKLKSIPEITAEGKKVTIKLKKDELKPNTTYRIGFGKAIADMNESNSIPNFEYVFSTGNSIDSLKIKGSVVEAFTNKPTSETVVGLYTGQQNDSILYKTGPDYLARTDMNGQFTFNNLPHTTFYVYAFTDKNKNGIYDGETEKVAFCDSPLKLSKDSSFQLMLFQEEPAKTFVKKTSSPYYGFSQILLNKKAQVEIAAFYPNDKQNILEIKPGQLKDTVEFFYRDLTDSLKILFKSPGAIKVDTLSFRLPKSNAGKKKYKSLATNVSANTLALLTPIHIRFFTWMDTSVKNLTRLKLSSKEDSLISTLPLKGRWGLVNDFELDMPLKEGTNYRLKIDTGAFYDLKSMTNDSAAFNFKTQARADLGKLTLKLRLNKKQAYLVQLITEQGQIIREKAVNFSLSSSNSVSIDFIGLPPGMYFAKLIFDDNDNKKWDSGHLIKHLQPERVIIHSKQLKVISDWETEEEIQFEK
jgi:uncharacterized protein (DUF2141 family)